jgi:hypothetical protein
MRVYTPHTHTHTHTHTHMHTGKTKTRLFARASREREIPAHVKYSQAGPVVIPGTQRQLPSTHVPEPLILIHLSKILRSVEQTDCDFGFLGQSWPTARLCDFLSLAMWPLDGSGSSDILVSGAVLPSDGSGSSSSTTVLKITWNAKGFVRAKANARASGYGRRNCSTRCVDSLPRLKPGLLASCPFLLSLGCRVRFPLIRLNFKLPKK